MSINITTLALAKEYTNRMVGSGGTGSGVDGGYYTPGVTQPTADTMQISFAPSKSDMPAVNPVTVNLPVSENSGQNVNKWEPMDGDKPRVYITGIKPTTKDNVLAELVYISKGKTIKSFIKIKCQGTSSMNYDKKNFTVTLYQDEERTIPLNLGFRDWSAESNKFVLKANYIDHSHLRNILGATLWDEIVESRPDYDTLPDEMKSAPRHGAIDGFPIKVYYNGTYEGIYTWNIGKDAWMWNMDEDDPNHVLLCAEANTDGIFRETSCNFRKLWNGNDGTEWSIEVGSNSAALKTSLNNLIQFVMDNDGEAFRAGIGQYLDIQSAIDYYILQYDICGLDGLAKNMLLATYDGTIWRCGAYDMDSTFGLHWTGTRFMPADFRCPEDYQEPFSLLWQRLEDNYVDELKTRQTELRKTVLSYANIVTHAERIYYAIGTELYAEDLTIYPKIPCGSTNNIQQIRNYVRDRHAYVDAEFAAMIKPIPATGVTLSQSTLTIAEKSPVTLTATVEPTDSTDTVIWESTNLDVATVDGGVVTPITNGSTTIRAIAGNVSAECAVTVAFPALSCTSITLSASELNFGDRSSQTLIATVEPADTTDEVRWETSNPAVATVEDGVVTAVDNGSATITARCGNQSATCAVTVAGIGEPVYKLTAPATFDGTDATVIDTGVKMFETARDWTILMEADLTKQLGSLKAVFGCNKSGCSGTMLYREASVSDGTTGNYAVGGRRVGGSVFFGIPAAAERLALRFSGCKLTTINWMIAGVAERKDIIDEGDFTAHDTTLVLGRRHETYNTNWIGTISQFELYDSVLSDADVAAFLES